MERVHAEENRALSRHGPFNSKSVHSYALPGSSEHHDNMKAMASEVKKTTVYLLLPQQKKLDK